MRSRGPADARVDHWAAVPAAESAGAQLRKGNATSMGVCGFVVKVTYIVIKIERHSLHQHGSRWALGPLARPPSPCFCDEDRAGLVLRHVAVSVLTAPGGWALAPALISVARRPCSLGLFRHTWLEVEKPHPDSPGAAPPPLAGNPHPGLTPRIDPKHPPPCARWPGVLGSWLAGQHPRQ